MSSNFFKSLTVFVSFSRNLAHMIYMYVPMRKNSGTDFRNFDFKIFLANFYFILNLDLVSGTA